MKKIAIVVIVLFFCGFSQKAHAEMWGNVKFGVYPVGKLVAPNGLTYKPLFHLGADINIGNHKDFYLFSESLFISSKAEPGITTYPDQGSFDFSKREFDIILGVAYRFGDNELRFWGYGYNNLNRGNDFHMPKGFKDGFILGTRYYFEKAGLSGYLNGGYYLTKDLVGALGQSFRPLLFIGVNGKLALDEKACLFFIATLISERSGDPYYLKTETGMTYSIAKDIEVRGSYFRNQDIKDSAFNQGLLFEIKRYFTAL